VCVMASTPHEDAFLDEVLGLFVLEAQEWINQSNTALLELEHHPASDRKHKLYDIIVCGITNLGGSAATVELRDLERLAYGLVPLVQMMQALNGSSSAPQLAALRDGFNRIMAVVQSLSETKVAQIPQLDQILKQLAEVTQRAVSPSPHAPSASASAPTEPQKPAVNTMDLLADFQRRPAGGSELTRHTVDAIIRKAKHDYGERGWRMIDSPTVVQIVQDLDRSDEEFLNEVRKRLPTIAGIFADLRSPHAEKLLSNGRVEKLLQEVQALHDSARLFDAKPVMQFFHGLHDFLVIRSQKVVEIAAARLEGVESRLKRILPVTEQWIELGKKERTAIEQLVRP